MENKNVVIKKLNSQSGASILVALLFFIVCIVAGSVVLASASAAAGRSAHLTDTETLKNQYAVDSAASVLKTQIEKDEVLIKIEGESALQNTIESANNASVSSWNVTVVKNDNQHDDSYLQTLVKGYLLSEDALKRKNYDDIFTKQDLFYYTNKGQVVVVSIDSTGVPDVKANGSLKEDMSLSIDLEANDAKTSLKGNVQAQVVEETTHIQSPEESSPVQQYQKIVTKVIRYSWSNLTIGK